MTAASSPENADVSFDSFDPHDEKRRESLLALGNGVLLVRSASSFPGTGYPGTYRAGLYDRRDDVVNGQHLTHDVLANLPDWLPLAVRPAAGEDWLSPATTSLLHYRHALDTKRGVSCREMVVRDPNGRKIQICERRLVSMVTPQLAAIRLEVELLGWNGTIEIRSAMHARPNANWPQEVPEPQHLIARCQGEEAEPGLLLLRTRLLRAGVEVAIAGRTVLSCAATLHRRVELTEDGIAEYLTCNAEHGRTVHVDKVVAICTSRDAASFEPAETALLTVRHAPNFPALLEEHRIAWERLWERCHIRSGSLSLDRALRLHAFHLLQTASPHSTDLDAGLPGRGWQEAYSGHVFWDQTFAFPVLALRLPAVARSLLLYRFRRLGAARAAARAAGWRGAMFPWRSATTGREETPASQPNPLDGTWVADNTCLARHIGLAIGRDIRTYVLATGDLEFLALYGGEMLVEIARFWTSLAQPIQNGRYDFVGVIGPDEFHTTLPGADVPGLATNAYTNVFASWFLARTPELLDMLPRPRREVLFRALRLEDDEMHQWARLSHNLVVAFHDDGVISQFAGYDRLRPLDLSQLANEHPGSRADLAAQADGDSINSHQAAKQADVLMLPYLLPGAQLRDTLAWMGYEVTHEQVIRTARFYLDRTVHDSSLSRVACAGALANLDSEASWQLYNDSLRLDLDPASGGSAAEGVHLGTMAATLDVLQRIYLGLDVASDGLVLSPALPRDLPPVSMRLFHRGNALDLEWSGQEMCLRSDPANLGRTIVHHEGQSYTLTPGSRQIFDVKTADAVHGRQRQ